eukprot:3251946-Prymnesium_polylepis.1
MTHTDTTPAVWRTADRLRAPIRIAAPYRARRAVGERAGRAARAGVLRVDSVEPCASIIARTTSLW